MTSQQHEQATPIRTTILHHANWANCDIRHKTNGAVAKCEAKKGLNL